MTLWWRWARSLHSKGKEMMNRNLSRRDFLKLAGVTSAGLALSACGVNVDQLSTPTATATVLPSQTPMPSPTQTPVVTPVFYEEEKNILNGLLQEGFTNGSLSKKFDIETSLLHTERNRIRNTDVTFVRDSQTGEIMLAGYLAGYMENEKIAWKVAGLGDLFGVFGIMLGTMLGEGFDQENFENPIDVAVRQDFVFMAPAGGFTVQYFNDWGPPRAVNAADKLKLGLRVAALYSSGAEADYEVYESGNKVLKDVKTKEDAYDYMNARIKQIIGVIKDAKKRNVTPLDIIFCNEPWWMNDNKIPRDLDDNLTELFGGSENVIVEYYTRFYERALEEGLVPGRDFNIIGINVPGLETDTQYARIMMGNILSIKKSIAQRLHIDFSDVNFDIGMQFHLGKSQGQRNITVKVPIDEPTLENWLKYVSEATGSRIHFTEVDYLEQKNDMAPDAYFALVVAAYNSGVVDTFNFWSTFRGKDDWVNPLFEGDNLRGSVYRLFKEKLTRLGMRIF